MRAFFAEAAGTAAKFLARPDGPRIGALAFNGWDTHVDEGADSGRLATLLGALDGAIAAVETSMGPVWKETVVTVVTEFGRTARINGTNGTDHGTGTIAILAGGALKGGRVVADWPGLKNAEPVRRPRPRGDHGPARGAEGPAQGSPARHGSGAGRDGVPGQRGRARDGGAGLAQRLQIRLDRRGDAVRVWCPAGRSRGSVRPRPSDR